MRNNEMVQRKSDNMTTFPSLAESTGDLPDRRRHPRMLLQMKLQCIRFDPDGQDIVTMLDTTDISRSGMGAFSDRPFYPGQRVLVCLPLTSMSGRRNIYATVTRCRPQTDGYSIGLAFDAASMGLWASPDHAAAAA